MMDDQNEAEERDNATKPKNVIMMIQTMITMMIHPPDNALRDKAESADASNFRSCAWRFTGEWSSLYNIEAEFQEV